MNQGYFFQLEKNSSQAEGTVVYRYIGIKAADKDTMKKYSIPEYPIYLVIKSSAIDFYFHGISHTENKDHAFAANEASQTSKESHVNIRILHLPLSKNIAVKDNLTSILINCYNSKYKINQIYRSAHNDNDATGSNQKIVYSNLNVFNSAISDNYAGSLISFKKLFLDFLFDLEHSQVFENSPHYEEAEIHLIENLFFHKIAIKASFYYQWQQFVKKTEPEARLIPALNLVDIEKQWLEHCLDRKSPLMFEESGGWFDPVETEVNQIIFRESRENWLQLVTNHHDKNDEINKSNTVKKNSTERKNAINEKLLINTSKWYLIRYNFRRAITSLFFLFSKIDWILSITLLALILIGVAAYISTSDSILKATPFSIDVRASIALHFNFLLNGFSALLIVFSFIVLHIHLICKKLFLPIVSILLPRLIVGLAGAWFFILTTQELVLANFDRDLSLVDIFLLLSLSIIILVFIMLQIKNINEANLAKSYYSHVGKLAGRSFIFLFISISFSIITGFISTNIFAKKTIECSGYLKTFFQELPANRYNDSIHREVEKIKSDSSKISNAELFSLLDNVYSKSDKKFQSNKILFIKYLKMPFASYSVPIYVFPRMLIYLAVFALFFGVFIQLIFEDKPVTEPL